MPARDILSISVHQWSAVIMYMQHHPAVHSCLSQLIQNVNLHCSYLLVNSVDLTIYVIKTSCVTIVLVLENLLLFCNQLSCLLNTKKKLIRTCSTTCTSCDLFRQCYSTSCGKDLHSIQHSILLYYSSTVHCSTVLNYQLKCTFYIPLHRFLHQ